ncbi:MAG TPA: hypothetical protein VFA89_21040 [Terriglobales bacterium]|nr:hypothetical protein [Terriglobales bacterium]
MLPTTASANNRDRRNSLTHVVSFTFQIHGGIIIRKIEDALSLLPMCRSLLCPPLVVLDKLLGVFRAVGIGTVATSRFASPFPTVQDGALYQTIAATGWAQDNAMSIIRFSYDTAANWHKGQCATTSQRNAMSLK